MLRGPAGREPTKLAKLNVGFVRGERHAGTARCPRATGFLAKRCTAVGRRSNLVQMLRTSLIVEPAAFKQILDGCVCVFVCVCVCVCLVCVCPRGGAGRDVTV